MRVSTLGFTWHTQRNHLHTIASSHSPCLLDFFPVFTYPPRLRTQKHSKASHALFTLQESRTVFALTPRATPHRRAHINAFSCFGQIFMWFKCPYRRKQTNKKERELKMTLASSGKEGRGCVGFREAGSVLISSRQQPCQCVTSMCYCNNSARVNVLL